MMLVAQVGLLERDDLFSDRGGICLPDWTTILLQRTRTANFADHEGHVSSDEEHC